MEKVFFKIIIPNFNSEEWISKCLDSILNQTFTDYKIVIVDDLSEDDSIRIIKDYMKKDKRIHLIGSATKLWNGGARNEGIKTEGDLLESQYTLFMDNDDWFNSNDCLQAIYNTIQNNPNVDCIRLPYCHYKGAEKTKIMLAENNPKDLVNSCFVAPWTKCIKSSLVVEFPENTLIEDVVQHIAQCDVIESVAVCEVPIIVWNRNNINSCSLEENKHFYNSKRVSSIYRNIADLMDLQCKTDYCEEHRKWRVECYKNIVKAGKEEHF